MRGGPFSPERHRINLAGIGRVSSDGRWITLTSASRIVVSAVSRRPFPSPNAQGSASSCAGWQVTDLARVVDELTTSGVTFEHYDHPPMVTDERGIATMGPVKGAWFKDPDGNTLSLIQM